MTNITIFPLSVLNSVGGAAVVFVKSEQHFFFLCVSFKSTESLKLQFLGLLKSRHSNDRKSSFITLTI